MDLERRIEARRFSPRARDPASAPSRNLPAVKWDNGSMKCDAKEIPDPLKPAASYLGKERLTLKDVGAAKSNQTHWIAAGSFTGKARMAGASSVEDISTEPGQPVAMVIVESEDRLLGILGPKDQSEPAIWWAWPLSALTVQTEGVRGTFRKRPRQISISGFGSRVDLFEISYVRNDKSSFAMGREAIFLKGPWANEPSLIGRARGPQHHLRSGAAGTTSGAVTAAPPPF